MSSSEPPYFSVVIPTRNRAKLFSAALDSVLDQTYQNIEIVVVNDGSNGAELDAYHELEARYTRDHPGKVRFEYLVHRPNGHGQSYSMNFGASLARGKYLCFLDDDDVWTAMDHLETCQTILESHTGQADLYYTTQTAVFPDGQMNEASLWLNGLAKQLDSAPDRFGAYRISVADALSAEGFAHLNCSVIRRAFYDEIGGMDENIRYECDRDIFIRSIDSAQSMLFNPKVISRHHIPDVKKASNMSTAITIFQKKLFQLTVFDKAILQSKNRTVARWAKRAKSYELKKIARTLADHGNYADALFYGIEALGSGFGLKWLAFVAYCAARRLAGNA